jgi:uncharacterized protein
LLVEFFEPIDLLDYVSLEEYCSNLIGIKVDLIEKKSVHLALRDKIYSEAIPA